MTPPPDHRPLLRGQEPFLDDLVPPGALEAGFMRSPWPRSCDQEILCEIILADILSHMRTTIDINDELLRAVKAHAASERKTLKATIEEALRELLAGPRSGVADAPSIPVFRGRGVQPGGRSDG